MSNSQSPTASSTDVVMTEANTNTSSENVALVESSSVNGADDAAEALIDPITALQDGIDGLSLAMFEALRGLRDAVAPESGNLGPAQNTTNNNNPTNTNAAEQSTSTSASSHPTNYPDAEELWQAYRVGDPSVAALFHKATHEWHLVSSPPTTRADVVALHARLEEHRDTQLVQQFANALLTKSRWIDHYVAHNIPGMHRTRTEQMDRIDQLIHQNAAALHELQETQALAVQTQRACRKFVEGTTCAALGIEEE